MGQGSRCEHGRKRSRCKDCKGGSICEHNRIRSQCKDCKGGSICQHNRIRTACKDCKGSQICVHQRYRSRCSRCSPRGSYNKTKHDAKQREIPFELSFEDYKWIVDSPCLYCGEAFEPMSVDRERSDHGYSFL